MRTFTLALAAAALLATAPAASAADFTVTGGKLDWTMANQYAGGGDAARTWLGYATNTAPVAGPPAAGKVEPTAPATITGPTGAAVTVIDGASPRGAEQLFTLGYPVAAAGGTYTDEGVGAVELEGTLTFTVHGFPITLVNPLVTLDGLTGTLAASGSATDRSGATAPFDRSKIQFTLDLSNATVTLRANGARTINGIVPVSTADTALAGFPTSSRRFGTMSLTLGLKSSPIQVGAAGRDGAAGKDGLNGTNGTNGRDAALAIIRLAKAPFATKAEVHVRLIDRATGKTIARGTVAAAHAAPRRPGRHEAQEGHLPAQAHGQERVRPQAGDGDAPVIPALSDRCLDLGDTCR